MISISLTEIVQFFKWIFRFKSPKVNKVILNKGNLFGIMKDGNQRQLTFSSCDSNFVYSKKRRMIIFIRSQEEEHFLAHQLMYLDTSDFKECLITDQKPQRDGLDGRFELLAPKGLKLSPNEKEVFFVLEKYATGCQLVKLNIASKQLKELFSAEEFEFIPSGKYEGKLLVSVSVIKDSGRDIYYEIRDKKGELIKEFALYDDYKMFRGNLSWNA